MLLKLWNWLSGKKTLIGLTLSLVSSWLLTLNLIDEGTHKLLLELSTLITGGGLVHKQVKGELF